MHMLLCMCISSMGLKYAAHTKVLHLEDLHVHVHAHVLYVTISYWYAKLLHVQCNVYMHTCIQIHGERSKTAIPGQCCFKLVRSHQQIIHHVHVHCVHVYMYRQCVCTLSNINRSLLSPCIQWCS